jgi:hypothetical protein
VDTGVSKGDVVAIWGWQVNHHLEDNYNMATYLSSGPVGHMCADFAFIDGASKVTMIDNN